MAQQGMNVDQVQNDGNQMKSVGTDGIPHVISQIDGIVSSLAGNWHGPDSEQFVNDWNNTHKPNLTTIAQQVAQQGTTALQNVEAQRQTSAAGSTA